jgi:hypothetical protein
MKTILISLAALVSFAGVASADERQASRSDIMAAYHSLSPEEARVIRREFSRLSRGERAALSRAYAGRSQGQIRAAMRAFAASRIS